MASVMCACCDSITVLFQSHKQAVPVSSFALLHLSMILDLLMLLAELRIRQLYGGNRFPAYLCDCSGKWPVCVQPASAVTSHLCAHVFSGVVLRWPRCS